MPIIKSAIKRSRQASKRSARNVITKKNLKATTRELDTAIAQKDAKKIGPALAAAQGAIDTAVKKHLIHANRAARMKARLTRLAKAAGGKMPTGVKTRAPAKPVAKKVAAKKPAAKKAPAKKAPAKRTATKKTTKK